MTTVEFWNLLVSSLSSILAAIAILLYVILWYKDKTYNSYDVFDATYLDILKTAIDHPEFRNYKLTNNYVDAFSDNERIKYEIFAFISWNFCETIYDKGDEKLMETWSVVIDTENQLHRKWFDNVENFGKFKESFRAYISKVYPASL